MGVKLTLSIDEKVIARAKAYAKNSGRSLSEIVETYLNKITSQQMDQEDSELNKIFGIISLPEDFDEKKAIKEIRINKNRST